MKITKEQLKRIIKEEIEAIREDRGAEEVKNAILQTDGWKNMLPKQAWDELYYDHGYTEVDIENVLQITTDAELGEFIYGMLSAAR